VKKVKVRDFQQENSTANIAQKDIAPVTNQSSGSYFN